MRPSPDWGWFLSREISGIRSGDLTSNPGWSFSFDAKSALDRSPPTRPHHARRPRCAGSLRAMADERQSEVLGALPRTRPQRRSAKRPARPDEPSARAASATPSPTRERPARSAAPKNASAAKPAPPSRSRPRAVGSARAVGTSRGKSAKGGKADRLRQPPQPRGIPSQPRSPVPSRPERPEILGTVVQAAAELTEIGLSLGAQALRRAVARLPRP